MKRSQTLFFIISSYVILTLLYLFPVLRNFRGLAGHGDAWQFLWNFWWIKWAFAHDQSIWFTDMLHWPNGISLAPQTFTLVSSLPAIFLSKFFSLITAYNLLIILHFILAGLVMYFLCYHITRNELASFAGGFLFTFSPYHFVHYYGHLHLMALWALPLATLFLLRTLEGRRWSWIGTAVFCALTAYADLYYFLFLFVLSVLLLLWHFPRQHSVIFRLVLIVVFTSAAVLPYLLPLAGDLLKNSDFAVSGHNPVFNSNDLKSFFIPGGRSVFRSITERYWSWWHGWEEMGSYVGYSIILLLILSLRRASSKTFWFWVFIGVLFAVLSLGPYLQIGGRVITSFRLPYAWFEDHFLILRAGGVPARFFVVTLMSLTVLVSMTLSKRGKLVTIIFLVFIAFEYLPAPLEVSSTAASPFYSKLAADKDRYAILDLSDAPAKVLFYQTIHEKPLVGGYTTRPTVSTERFLAETNWRDRKTLENLNVRYVLMSPGEKYAEGFDEIYSDEFLTAYRVY